MIRMKAEAVVITKPDKNTNLNGANINMNGKVLLADVADKGYKGAGMLSGEVVLCVASGDRETKAAETAMNILTKHIPAIKTSGDSFPAEADAFFNHAFRELSIQKGAYEAFSATLLYNYAGNVYIANTGDNAVYTYDGMYLDQISFAPEETGKKDVDLPTSDVFYKVITDIKPNTQILVFSKEVYEYTTDEQILDILRNALSPKQACQRLIDQAAENGAESFVTVMIENLTPTEVPVAGAAVPHAEGDEPAEELPEEAYEEEVSKPSKAPLIVLILLLVLVALIAGLYFANQRYDFIGNLTAGRTTETTEDPSATEPAANLITLPSTTERPTEEPASTSDTTAATTEAEEEEEEEENRRSTTTRRTTTTTRRTTTTEAPTDPPTTTQPETDAPSTDEPTDAPSTDEPSDEPSAEPSNETPSADAPGGDELEDR